MTNPDVKNASRRMLKCLISTLFLWNNASARDTALDDKQAAQRDMPKKCYANEYELSQCLSQLAIEEEARLVGLRSKVKAALEEEQRKPFEDLESEWKKYRQASCDFDSALAAGNSKSTRHSECILVQTQSRVRVLSEYLTCITSGGCGNDVRLYMIELRLIGRSR